MAKAIIYCRVSTDKQVEEGNSLELQEKICRDFAVRNDCDIFAEPFVEEGESAKTANRTKLIEMMGFCQKNKGKIQVLIIYKINRFARNTEDYLTLKVFFKNLGVKIMSVTEGLQDTPSGRFNETILAAQAQFDNEVRGEVCKGGSIGLVQKGMRNGKPPIGLEKVGAKKDRAIVRFEPQASLINKAFELLDTQVYSEMDVYRMVTAEGLTHHNGNKVEFVYFDKMIRNPIYKGVLTDYNQNVESDLIEKVTRPELFDRVQNFLNGKKRKVPKYQKNRIEFALRGSMKCTHNKKATGSPCTGRNGTRYFLYRFDCPDCDGKRNFNNDYIHGKYADYLDQFKYDEDLINALKIAISANWENRNAFISKKAKDLEKKLLIELEGKEQMIIDKILKGVFNDELGKEQLHKVREEKTSTKSELDGLVVPKKTENEVIEFGLNFMKNLSKQWKSQNNLEIKQRFQNFFFPEGITFNQNQEFETTVFPLCMRIKSLCTTKNEPLVASRGIGPLLPH